MVLGAGLLDRGEFCRSWPYPRGLIFKHSDSPLIGAWWRGSRASGEGGGVGVRILAVSGGSGLASERGRHRYIVLIMSLGS